MRLQGIDYSLIRAEVPRLKRLFINPGLAAPSISAPDYHRLVYIESSAKSIFFILFWLEPLFVIFQILSAPTEYLEP